MWKKTRPTTKWQSATATARYRDNGRELGGLIAKREVGDPNIHIPKRAFTAVSCATKTRVSRRSIVTNHATQPTKNNQFSPKLILNHGKQMSWQMNLPRGNNTDLRTMLMVHQDVFGNMHPRSSKRVQRKNNNKNSQSKTCEPQFAELVLNRHTGKG